MKAKEAAIIAGVLMLSACQPAVTYRPEISEQELKQERAIQEQMIAQSKAMGGTPRTWRNKKNLRDQFERVGDRVEKAGADVCRAMGIPRQDRRCYYYFYLSRDADLNAYADGETVVIHTGMMRFVQSDEELAMIMAHELAHNLMGHPQAGGRSSLAGELVGALMDTAAASQGVSTGGGFRDIGAELGDIAYSVEYEQEADYVGLYIMARAGYNVSKALDFWRRFSLQEPEGAMGGTTHPSNPARLVAMKKTIYEIGYKRTHRIALVPDFKQNVNNS